MRKEMVVSIVVLLVFCGLSFGAVPTYQPIPADANQILASGIADTSSEFGTAFVEYWVWDGGNDYYYYTYMIHNQSFLPFAKHLTISNPSGKPYVITGISGGIDENGNTGSAWSTVASTSMMVDWVGDQISVVRPGESSWQEPMFQFASQLPPSVSCHRTGASSNRMNVV